MSIPPDLFRKYSRDAALRWLGGARNARGWVNTRDGWACFADIGSAAETWKLRDADRLWPAEPWPEEVNPDLFFPHVFVECQPERYIYAGTGHPVQVRRRRDGRFDAELLFEPGLPLDVARALRAGTSSLEHAPPEWLAEVEGGPASAIARFAAWWYGDDVRPFAEPSAQSVDLPPVLHWLHENGLARSHQNSFVPADELAVEEGKLIFYVENQGVCVWACDADTRDGPVWIRWLDRPDWQREADRLTVFLLQACVFEALGAAPESALASWVAPSEANRLTTRLSELQAPPWSWPTRPHRFFAGPGLLASACPNEDGITVWLGARSAEVLDALQDGIDADWS